MEARTMPEKPSKVTTAVIMLCISLGMEAIGWLWMRSLAGRTIGHWDFVAVVVVGPILVSVYYMIGKGKNWARLIVLIILIHDVTVLALSVTEDFGAISFSVAFTVAYTIFAIGTTSLKIVAVAFLFQRESSHWFKAMKNLRQLPPYIEEQGIVEVSWHGQKDLENLVARIKADLAEGTRKGTVIGMLVRNGWDKQEATQFAKQIAYELTTNPKDVQLVVERYEKYMLFGGVVAAILAALPSGVSSPRNVGG